MLLSTAVGFAFWLVTCPIWQRRLCETVAPANPTRYSYFKASTGLAVAAFKAW